MKKSIKLLTTISTIFAANVFGAGTPESHIINANPRFEQSQGVVCDKSAAVPSENWNPKTLYCMMQPDGGNGDERTYDTLEKIRSDFVRCVGGAFPQAKISTNDNWHVTVFTDQDLGKYQPGVLDAARQALLNTVKPFVADLYDMYLFVVYEEGGVKKYMSFLPNAPMQAISLKNLAESGQDALPISELASFAPAANCGKKILRSHLVVRLGTDGLISAMVDSLSKAYEQAGLRKIVPFTESQIGHMTLASMQTGFFIAPDKANSLIGALNGARNTLRGNDSGQKMSLGFRTISLTAVDPVHGGSKPKTLLSGELN